MAAAAADTVTFGLLGVVVVVGLIVVWRVVIHDRTIRKVRFGVFWERERDPELELEERLARKDERP